MNQILENEQADDVNFDPYIFDGVWRLSKEASKVLDPETGEYVDETLHDQWATHRTEGDRTLCEMVVQVSPDLTIREEYTATFGSPEWVPYTVTAIEGDPSHPLLQPEDDRLLKSGLVVGKAGAWVKLVYVDARTQVRITKNPDGSAQYTMVSRVSEDGQRISGYVLTPDGQLVITKHMDRESD